MESKTHSECRALASSSTRTPATFLGMWAKNSRITQASGRFVFEQSTLTILWQDPATLPSAGDGS